jgi:hypothetical protein
MYFSRMNLIWYILELRVHVYFDILWENWYKKSYSLICDQFIAHIYFFLFEKECPRLSNVAKRILYKFVHWYLDECDTYIQVFGTTKAPHLLPVYVPDWPFIGEICYQTILQGYNATLVKDKKRAFIPYGFHIGFYMVNDTAQAKQEGLSQLDFLLQNGCFHKEDPKGLVLKHISHVSSCWPYAHDRFEDEIYTENAQSWDEVVARMVDPKETKFKAMIWDGNNQLKKSSGTTNKG